MTVASHVEMAFVTLLPARSAMMATSSTETGAHRTAVLRLATPAPLLVGLRCYSHHAVPFVEMVCDWVRKNAMTIILWLVMAVDQTARWSWVGSARGSQTTLERCA